MIKLMTEDEVNSLPGVPADTPGKASQLIAQQADGTYFIATLRGPFVVTRNVKAVVKGPSGTRKRTPKASAPATDKKAK